MKMLSQKPLYIFAISVISSLFVSPLIAADNSNANANVVTNTNAGTVTTATNINRPKCCLKDGCYVGAQVGYDSYRVRHNMSIADDEGDVFIQNPTLNPRGFLLGAFVGFGKYCNNYYLGWEGVVNSRSADTDYTMSATTDGEDGQETDSIRTRFSIHTSYGLALLPGFKINPSSLFYIRLGYNWANLYSKETFTGDGLSVSNSRTSTVGGFAYGLGIETLFCENLSLRAQYTFADYSSFTSRFGTRFYPSDNQFMLGVVYHFA